MLLIRVAAIRRLIVDEDGQDVVEYHASDRRYRTGRLRSVRVDIRQHQQRGYRQLGHRRERLMGTARTRSNHEHSDEAIIHWAALTVAVIACITDLRTRRIPNVLTFGAAIAALVFHVVTGGWSGALTSAGGWLAGVARLFLPHFFPGRLGGWRREAARRARCLAGEYGHPVSSRCIRPSRAECSRWCWRFEAGLRHGLPQPRVIARVLENRGIRPGRIDAAEQKGPEAGVHRTHVNRPDGGLMGAIRPARRWSSERGAELSNSRLRCRSSCWSSAASSTSPCCFSGTRS